MKILLRGYYGFGNLGDDILMITSAKLLKQIFPKSKVMVMSASTKAGYIIPLLEENIDELLEYGKEPVVDLVVHGGGGTYYDFDGGPSMYKILNFLIDAIGIKNWARLYSLYRRLKGWQIPKDAMRIGIGLGIDKFTESSKKYYYKMSELYQFDLLYVRDKRSWGYVKNRGLNNNVYLSTDLAFMKELWLPKSVKNLTEREGIVFILKNTGQNNYLQTIQSAIARLKKKGYKITMLFFERDHDLPICNNFGSELSFVWEPKKIRLQEYLKILAGQRLVITSRAHGAILAGAFDIPAICLGVEPKMEAIRGMFPNSGSLLRVPFSEHELILAIDNGMSVDKEDVTKDFVMNQEIMLRDTKRIKRKLIEYELGE